MARFMAGSSTVWFAALDIHWQLTSQRTWYFQKEHLEKQKWFTNCFSQHGLNNGHSFITMNLKTWLIATPVSQNLSRER